jgi:ADP-ribosylglycohydrolase
MSIPTILRYRGSILGLAAGDAVGTTVEFQAPGTFEPVIDMIGGGVFQLQPGHWTDDTSMALCLAESLIQYQGFNLVDELTRYCRWYRDEYFSLKTTALTLVAPPVPLYTPLSNLLEARLIICRNRTGPVGQFQNQATA